MCSDKVGKAKAHLQINMSRDMKDNRKILHVAEKKPRENAGTLLNESGQLKTKDVEITEVLQTHQEGD